MAVLSRAFFLTISKTACNGQPRREYLDEGIDLSWPQRRANYQQTTIGEEGVMRTRIATVFSLSAALAVGTTTMSMAAEPLAKSGSFKTESGFKSVEDMIQVGEKHTYSHGVTWGIVSNDNPLRIKTAMCPYISELAGDTSTFDGRCTWSDADGDKIFTTWSGKFSATGAGGGPQTITGGTGKFSSIQGTNPFQCQALNDKGQLACTQQWDYRL